MSTETYIIRLVVIGFLLLYFSAWHILSIEFAPTEPCLIKMKRTKNLSEFANQQLKGE